MMMVDNGMGMTKDPVVDWFHIHRLRMLHETEALCPTKRLNEFRLQDDL